MTCREVWEIELKGGKLPISRWVEKNLDGKEKARLAVRIYNIEVEEVISKEWLAPYTSLKMMEIRFNNNSKAIRILCHQDTEKLIMLVAAKKNGDITKEDEERAVRLRSELVNGEIGVRRYPLPQRP